MVGLLEAVINCPFSVEDYRFVAIKEDAVFDMPADGA
jgi:hypothetical protein